jgi:hypothetical protein
LGFAVSGFSIDEFSAGLQINGSRHSQGTSQALDPVLNDDI